MRIATCRQATPGWHTDEVGSPAGTNNRFNPHATYFLLFGYVSPITLALALAPLPMNDDDFQKRLAQLRRYFTDNVPHNRALGLEIVDLGPARARFRLPYDQKLVGNPERGILHGGAITTLIDAACGGAVFMALDKPMTIATLDLRIDYLRAAEPPRDVIASAECFRVTKQVAFVRAVAFHDSETDPIAAAAGSFMLGTRSGRHQKESPA